MKIPAVVTAGDRGAAKAVYGESKGYLEIAGRPLLAQVVAMLQSVPEISEIWVVGNPERVASMLAAEPLRSAVRKPVHVMAQLDNLYENAWGAYRRLLPGAGDEGRVLDVGLFHAHLNAHANLLSVRSERARQVLDRAEHDLDLAHAWRGRLGLGRAGREGQRGEKSEFHVHRCLRINALGIERCGLFAPRSQIAFHLGDCTRVMTEAKQSRS